MGSRATAARISATTYAHRNIDDDDISSKIPGEYPKAFDGIEPRQAKPLLGRRILVEPVKGLPQVPVSGVKDLGHGWIALRV